MMQIKLSQTGAHRTLMLAGMLAGATFVVAALLLTLTPRPATASTPAASTLIALSDGSAEKLFEKVMSAQGDVT